MKTEQAVLLLSDRAAEQWGLLTAAQAADDGIDTTTLTRLHHAGLLNRLAQGVYQLAGATDMLHLDEKVAWLRLAPGRPVSERRPLESDGGVLSHRSAARLHDIGDLDAPKVEIIVPTRRQTRDRAVKLRREHLEPRDVTTVEGALPVTTIERTIADLAAEHFEAGHLGDMIADARKRGVLNENDLARRLAGFGPAYGAESDGNQVIDHLVAQAGRSAAVAMTPADVLAAIGEGLTAYARDLGGVHVVSETDAVKSIRAKLTAETGADLQPAFAGVVEQVRRLVAEHPALLTTVKVQPGISNASAAQLTDDAPASEEHA